MAAIFAVFTVAVVIIVDWISGEASSAVGSADPEPTSPDLRRTTPSRRGATVR